MLVPDWLDPQSLLESLGPWAVLGILLIVFAECGLLIGFFLPGDALLFTAGLLVATGFIDTNILLMCILITIAAVSGNFVGYWIGRKAGPRVFNRSDSRLFRQEYVDRTSEFFERYGPRALVLARFVPIVRTFITVMAGAAHMRWRTYVIYSTVGGIVWAFSVTILGYYLGNVAFIQKHIELIILGMVAISVIPIYFELRRHRGEPSES